MKLFGFRSNKIWKKVMSIVYLIVWCLLFLVIMTEGKYPNLETKDFVINKLSNLIIFCFFLSPYIFLSQTKIREKLPLLNKFKLWTSSLFFVVLFIITILINSAVLSLHTDEYVADMENHAYVLVSSTEATCEVEGLTERTCGYCGRKEREVFPAKGHTMQIVIENEDEKVEKCQICGYEETDDKNSEKLENKKEEKTVKQNDKVIKLIVKKCGVSEEEAEQVKKDFESVGINELTGFTEFEGAGVEGMKSFKYTSKTVSGTLILTNDGANYTTNYISSGDITLFDSSKGGVLDNISRYYLSDDEKSLYLYQSEELIKQCLRSPSSADFPNWYSGSWQIGRRDDVITIVSYVDAQNAFGAMIRSKFVLQFSHANQLCTYCQLDGEVISGKYKEVK